MDKMKSRKLAALIIGVAAILLSKYLGMDLDAESKTALVTILSAYMLGQGIADHGKPYVPTTHK